VPDSKMELPSARPGTAVSSSTTTGVIELPITVRGLVRAPLVEVAALAACVAVGALAVVLLPHDPVGVGVLHHLPADLAVVAAALLAAAAGTSGNPRTRLVAAAVAAYVTVPLLLRGVPGEVEQFWLLAASTAALGSVGLLALTLRTAVPRPDRAPLLIGGLATALLIAVVVARAVAPDAPPSSWLVLGAGMLAWSGAGAVGMLVTVSGTLHGRVLPRRVGVAFVALAAAHAIALVSGTAPGAVDGPVGQALQLGAALLLVWAAAGHLAATVDGVRDRLAAADAALAAAADREEELRAAVAALPGPEAGELRRLLDEREDPPDGAAVAPLLRDLAVVHRSSGLAVDLDVDPDLRVGMDHWALGQVLTNLLVNCERHAPGAHVWLRARRENGRVRLEVADDGPGLPEGAAPEVLRRDGHGLATAAEIVNRYGGTFTLISAERGCIAALELPVQRIG